MPDTEKSVKKSWFYKALPALSLMFIAPMVAEVLPGATRISSIFVLPIMILIWGGGATLIRFFWRKYQLGWLNLVLLALCLSIAEEFLIQQTSVAPMVLKLKGVEYARAFDVNYVYFAWALLYEAIFVVLLPIGLTEMIFADRRTQPWLSGWGIGITTALFLPACFLAWFTWTQIARPQFFHVPAFHLPLPHMIAGITTVAVLMFLALGPVRRAVAAPAKPIVPPYPLIIAILAAAVTTVIFGLVLLGFGLMPEFNPAYAMLIAAATGMILIAFLPGFMAHPKWSRWHQAALIHGALIANMAVFFFAFQGAIPLDLYGKIIMDVIAVLLLIWLMIRRARI